MSKHDFSSTQINCDKEISDIILEKGKSLVRTSQLFSDDGREDQPHVTVLYGIHSNFAPLKIVDIIETHPKFAVRLGKISLFKGDETGSEFDVVKVEVESSDLHYLNSAFQENCECTVTFPEYKPHLTIAYVKKNECDHLEGLKLFDGITWIVNSIMFSNHDGEKREIRLARR